MRGTKSAPGDGTDVPPLRPEKIAGARLFASIADYGEPVIVPHTTPASDVLRQIAASAAGGPELCFLDYATWLPEGEKNPLIRFLNAAINETDGIVVKALVLDADGMPSLVVGQSQA